ncbi:hypothetical protein ACFYXP_01395 [Streptomyces sp. NPDC002466]|uniref:hypothetical protein n=1 Tax=unclassified Streptomyces TaxID=2593676 RepID=UPI0035D84D08
MRRAQALLDETQAERSRALAAFAVTVGDDGSIADLMGLKEREVRLARRAVGRSNARSLAAELLGQAPRAPKNPVNKPFASSDAPAPAPQPGDESPSSPPTLPQQQPYAPDAMAQEPPDAVAPGPVRAPQPPPAPEAVATAEPVAPSEPAAVPEAPELVPAVFQTPAPFPAAPPEPVHPVAWSPSMDSVLLWSWESGLDLQTVAGELGLDVRTLLMRVQELADDGLIVLAAPVAEVSRSGRHRRHEEGYAGLFGPTTTFPSHVSY